MIAGYAIEQLLALVKEKYPDWQDFTASDFHRAMIAPVRRLSERAKKELSKAEFRDLLGAANHDGLWARFERLGRQSPLLWTGQETTSDLAILYQARARGELWPLLEQLRSLIYDRRPSPDRIEAFADFCAEQGLPCKWAFTTHFGFLVRPHAEIMVKPRLARWFLQFMGMGEIYIAQPSAATYERLKKTVHGLLAELKPYGARDMIDIYGLMAAAYQVSQERVGGLKLEAQIDLDRPPALAEERPLYNVQQPRENGVDEIEQTAVPPVSLAQLSKQIGWPEEEIAGWVAAVNRKKQVIFYGPPGTGKTYIATYLAQHLVGGGDGLIKTVQFHPAYDYTDFIEGIRPQTGNDGRLTYVNRPGLFLKICRAVAGRRGQSVLIIDEINRANLAQVFGELMYLLEYRDETIELASGRPLAIPDNLLILGTMNTADRSIALIDHALRRRFAFIHLAPRFDLLLQKTAGQKGIDGPALVNELEKINRAIGDPHFHLGISYFLVDDLAALLPQIWRMEIEPYLEELFTHQPDLLESFRWDKISAGLLL